MDYRGVFVTYDSEEISTFLNLNDKTFVIDHRCVKPWSSQLFTKFSTNDIDDVPGKKTVDKIKQLNRQILMNNTVIKFPTEMDQMSY